MFVGINNKLWSYLNKIVRAFWWILDNNYWDDRGVWMDDRADKFFRTEDLS